MLLQETKYMTNEFNQCSYYQNGNCHSMVSSPSASVGTTLCQTVQAEPSMWSLHYKIITYNNSTDSATLFTIT